MKKLLKINLHDLGEVMNDEEMKWVVGGYSGSNVCMSDDGRGHIICTMHPQHAAEEGSGSNTSWWCCNCKEAYDTCGGYLYPGTYPPR